MSDTFGTSHGTPADPPSAGTVHEAYSFACMMCGHGWEQSYEITHHTDEHGHTTVAYFAGTQRVPSPLTRPTCPNCDGHQVRIMRAGRVASARWDHLAYASRTGGKPAAGDDVSGTYGLADAGGAAAGGGSGGGGERHHWFADLLAHFHRRTDPGTGHGDRAA